MATVLGNNLTLYVGDGMRTIGCEDSCTLTIENQLINVTTKGSGRGTNREYGGYDWNIQSSGVIFINSDFDGSGSNLDPFEFLAYSLEGKKVAVKFYHTDGTTEKWLCGNGVIGTCSYVGQAGEHAMYNVTILADGLLYPTSNLQSSADYDGPTLLEYIPGGTLTNVTIAGLAGNNHIFYISKNGVLYNSFKRYTGTLPITSEEVKIKTTDGDTTFSSSVTTTDTILFWYD
jgi:hypothetical protein